MQGTTASRPSTAAAAATTTPAAVPFIGLGLKPQQMTTENKTARKTGATARKNLPSPKEMIAHYESQGMQPQEASLKVIDDLQNLLLRVVATKKSGDLDAVSTQLRRLEAKLESKPGYSQALGFGVASGAVVSAFPHVVGSVVSIWNSVRSSSSSN